jgi:hypothetical protein
MMIDHRKNSFDFIYKQRKQATIISTENEGKKVDINITTPMSCNTNINMIHQSNCIRH